MAMKKEEKNPRQVIKNRLNRDLEEVEEADIRSAVLCGEMGCDEMETFISENPQLRCPYSGRVEDPAGACEQLRREYLEVISKQG